MYLASTPKPRLSNSFFPPKSDDDIFFKKGRMERIKKRAKEGEGCKVASIAQQRHSTELHCGAQSMEMNARGNTRRVNVLLLSPSPA